MDGVSIGVWCLVFAWLFVKFTGLSGVGGNEMSSAMIAFLLNGGTYVDFTGDCFE